jgi:hypothetical protein
MAIHRGTQRCLSGTRRRALTLLLSLWCTRPARRAFILMARILLFCSIRFRARHNRKEPRADRPNDPRWRAFCHRRTTPYERLRAPVGGGSRQSCGSDPARCVGFSCRLSYWASLTSQDPSQSDLRSCLRAASSTCSRIDFFWPGGLGFGSLDCRLAISSRKRRARSARAAGESSCLPVTPICPLARQYKRVM